MVRFDAFFGAWAISIIIAATRDGFSNTVPFHTTVYGADISVIAGGILDGGVHAPCFWITGIRSATVSIIAADFC